MDSSNAVRDLLTDSFTRVTDLTARFGGLDQATATARPGPDANSIAWLLWHSARVLDDHISGLSGNEQVWANGWYERFGLPFAYEDFGFGHTSDQVAQVTTPVDELIAYQAEVHAATLDYISKLTLDELERVVDTRWDPPVTVGVRLVSVNGDCLQHLGQAAYIRGMVS